MITKRLVLEDVPRIGFGQVNGRGPTDYSLPGCLGNIICYIDSCEDRENDKSIHLDNKALDRMNQLFMNVTGICYATLWSDDFDGMVNELHRINDFDTLIDRCMRFSGRNYTYMPTIPAEDLTAAGCKGVIVDSIRKGRPLLMEFAAGIPEFNIITGFDDYGDTLIGWAYCAECVNDTEPNGMFKAQVDWSKPFSKMVVIGDKTDSSLSDKDIFRYAIETMERTKSQDTSYKEFTAGFDALEKWYNAMSDHKNSLLDGRNNSFLHLMILNLAEPRAYFWGYVKELATKYADNGELKMCFSSMVDSSVELADYGRAMWRVKDADISESKKRTEWCQLLRSTIESDRKLLGNMKKIVSMLND